MDPEMEIEVDGEVDVNEVEEMTPEDRIETFATDVASMAKEVASGDMTPEAFMEALMPTVEELSSAMAPEAMSDSPMGGLGADSAGDFPLPEPMA